MAKQVRGEEGRGGEKEEQEGWKKGEVRSGNVSRY